MDALPPTFRGIIGLIGLILIAWTASGFRRNFPWRVVGGGFLLQLLVLGALQLSWVSASLLWFSSRFVQVMGFASEGGKFAFGVLADKEALDDTFGNGFVFVSQIIPSILFVAALTSLFFYLGVLQWIVRAFAMVLGKTMKLSGPESLATAANIFIGQTEAPLLVKPYLPKMSDSELLALMTGGMATIAGGVMVVYIAMLGGEDPEAQARFAQMLLTASFMNAPAALVFAKILIPSDGPEITVPMIDRRQFGTDPLDAIAQGTQDGLRLAMIVTAMIIVFVALIAAINGLLAIWGWSLDAILGWLFAPLAILIGIENADVRAVGGLLGIKVAVNEFLAFDGLSKMADDISPRSLWIATFALCGFANLGSIGIQIGGIGELMKDEDEAKQRANRARLAKLSPRALLAGTLATLSTATWAGIFYR